MCFSGSSDNLEYENLSHATSATSKTLDMFNAYQFVCKCINDTSSGKKYTADH